ncbi:hypothetical protein RhiirA5_394564 [Rhizophagus irregularis]|nr:hypothetical protein RhiirA5_394564 [Rhizophagus irregularis]PKC72549.1 hypothetical protein RhiirA1_438179 [Rhizophagus irregularis]UZO23048.1 hypothetical protein OCT59_015394 [Rhizophagus irregularis]GBC18715.2 hypothetical protein GLOIN_2v1474414 [Rhizophagus irregularis DAOM 181602=DAOM 197198]
MSESKISRSLFPQFTEEQLEEVSKIFKSSVNWTSYKKWVEDGKPYEEHDELIGIRKLENGSQRRPTGTVRGNVDRNGEHRNGSSSHHSVRKTARTTGKKGNRNTSPTRAT